MATTLHKVKRAAATGEAAAAATGAPATARAGLAVGDMKTIRLAKMPKTGELIARELRRRIVRGELKEGAFLPSESELMAQLSVSRSSLREALRILESESLLTVRRGSRGGPIVHRPDPNLAAKYFGLVLQARGTTLQDVYIARMLIEPPAVRMVVQNAKGRTPASLHAIMDEERAALQAEDIPRLTRGITQFHEALVELTGNRTLLLIMHMLNIIYEQHIAALSIAIGADFDRLKASRLSLKAQERLVQFIEAGDEDAAVAYWRKHVSRVKEILFEHDHVRHLIDVVALPSPAAVASDSGRPAAHENTDDDFESKALRRGSDLQPFALEKIPKTGELIARELRKRIVRGELGEGASLPPETELMAHFAVSRASLREALRILESESLVTVRRGSQGGPVVQRPDPDLAARYFGLLLQMTGTTLMDVYLARLLIEPPAVRLLVQNARDEAPAVLREIVERQRAASAAGDARGVLTGIARFHESLIELTGNQTLLLIMHMLNIIYQEQMGAINAAGVDYDEAKVVRMSAKSQERLLELVEAGDEDGAVNHWRGHLLKAREYLTGPNMVTSVIDVLP